MKKNLTELVFILDKSGSMYGLEKDTIGGFNSMLKKQKEEEGECILTTVLFDDGYELLHDRIDIQGGSPMTDHEYFVGGSTALLDAIGRTINKIVTAQKHTAKEYQAEKVMFVIITDGHENASCEYSARQIRKMIEKEKKEYGWEFIFLGTNIDAVETASHFGIEKECAVDYVPDKEGTMLNYEVMSKVISGHRKGLTGSLDSLNEIRKDMKARGNGTGGRKGHRHHTGHRR